MENIKKNYFGKAGQEAKKAGYLHSGGFHRRYPAGKISYKEITLLLC